MKDFILVIVFVIILALIVWLLVAVIQKNTKVQKQRQEDPRLIKVGPWSGYYDIVTLPAGERVFVVFRDTGGISTCLLPTSTQTVEKP